jgi:ribosomal protein L37AE/L43A
MADKIALRMMKCPKCGSKHIDEFEDDYWFLCRDCGYNSPACADEAEAISAFCAGIVERGITSNGEEENNIESSSLFRPGCRS